MAYVGETGPTNGWAADYADVPAGRARGAAGFVRASAALLPPAGLDHIPLAVWRALGSCSEIDCLRHRLAPATIAAAESRARALGVGADEVLITFGRCTAEEYARALAASLMLRFEPLGSAPRELCTLTDDMLSLAANAGLLPVRRGSRQIWAMAPRGLQARRLIAQVNAHPELRRQICITSPGQIQGFVKRHAAAALAGEASDGLRRKRPLWSAASSWRPAKVLCGCLAAACTVVAALAPALALALLQLFVTAMFLAWTALRVAGGMRRPLIVSAARIADEELPTYTIIVPLHREAAVLPRLVRSLQELHYPAEKLQILIVLEWDDVATRRAAAALRLGPPFEIVLAPPGDPRTKPKALNAALLLARGEFIVIFDAEDRPEPDQLRRALQAFAGDDETLVCVQARLTIDNTADGWLARLFTAEYAGQFDVLLPGLAAFRLPIPLGGSSNHFKTAILRQAGAWDPYNVTEDADLGTRLARLGYRTAVIASSTYEEAPSALRPWLRQRTRWFKGWMLTWCVHMRQPGRLLDELGAAGFASFQLLLIGTVFAGLVQPFALLAAAWTIANAAVLPGDATPLAAIIGWFHLGTWIAGYAASIVLAFVGLRRRRLLRIASALLWMPAHWALLSVAAWRALWQLIVDPYRWDKTEHGLARTSRLAAADQM
ncbi:MAG TPA: glycosyltransferase [Xanthobacteraceae bacterium]